jgi:acetyltransferase-like isoleucine patch superfamily enzyme
MTTKIESTAVVEDGVVIGKYCYIGHFTLIRKGAIIGNNTQIRSHCYIGEDVKIGNQVLIRPFSDICKSTIIEDKVFIGMGCMTSNTKKISYLRDYENINTPSRICYAARIGVGVTILPGVVIGENCLIGAGSLVIKNTNPKGVYIGVPAVYTGEVEEEEIL